MLPGLDRIAASAAMQIAFGAGVGIASFGWQCILVAVGAVLRRRAGASFRLWTVLLAQALQSE